jgi:hypothetical protein
MPPHFISIQKGNISRRKREKILDEIRMGADIGKYTPKFLVIDPMPKAPKFSGRFTFTPMHEISNTANGNYGTAINSRTE